MIIGIVVGVFMGENVEMFVLLGVIFINLIKMLVILLVVVVFIFGVVGFGNSINVGKVGLFIFVYFVLMLVFVVILVFIMGEVFKLGIGIDVFVVEGMFFGEYVFKGELFLFWVIVIGMIFINVFVLLINVNIF